MFTTIAFAALGLALVATPFVAAVALVLRKPKSQVLGIEVVELDVEYIEVC